MKFLGGSPARVSSPPISTTPLSPTSLHASLDVVPLNPSPSTSTYTAATYSKTFQEKLLANLLKKSRLVSNEVLVFIKIILVCVNKTGWKSCPTCSQSSLVSTTVSGLFLHCSVWHENISQHQPTDTSDLQSLRPEYNRNTWTKHSVKQHIKLLFIHIAVGWVCHLEVSHLNTPHYVLLASLCLLVKKAPHQPLQKSAGFKHCIFNLTNVLHSNGTAKICSSCLV